VGQRAECHFPREAQFRIADQSSVELGHLQLGRVRNFASMHPQRQRSRHASGRLLLSISLGFFELSKVALRKQLYVFWLSFKDSSNKVVQQLAQLWMLLDILGRLQG